MVGFAYQDIKGTSLEMVGWTGPFLSGYIDEVGHCMASDVHVLVTLQQNLISTYLFISGCTFFPQK